MNQTSGLRSEWDSVYCSGNRRAHGIPAMSQDLLRAQRTERLQLLEAEIGGTGAAALEAGCGLAIDLEEIASSLDLAVGLDQSLPALLMARGRLASVERINLVRGDIRYLPFREGSFDLVYNAGVLEHVSDPTGSLREMARVAKKSGTVIATVPNLFSFWTVGRKVLGLLNKLSPAQYPPWPVTERSFSPTALARLTEEAGFREYQIVGLFLEHYVYALELALSKLGQPNPVPPAIGHLVRLIRRLSVLSSGLRMMFGMDIAAIVHPERDMSNEGRNSNSRRV